MIGYILICALVGVALIVAARTYVREPVLRSIMLIIGVVLLIIAAYVGITHTLGPVDSAAQYPWALGTFVPYAEA